MTTMCWASSRRSCRKRSRHSLDTERSLDGASSVVMMRHTNELCTVYLGNPEGPREELKQIGAISTALANEMLESTSSGVNLMQIDGQTYRFARSFTEVGGVAAVVFSTE